MEILNTQRLMLKTTKKEDFKILHEVIFSDKNVYRYTFGKEGFTFEQTCQFLKTNANFSSKIGLSTLIEKTSSNIIGLAGVLPCDIFEKEDFEIGFILAKNAWGKGYAKEIGFAQIEFVKNTLKKPRVLALASPKNENSIKTIKSLGLIYIKNTPTPKGERAVFMKEFTF